MSSNLHCFSLRNVCCCSPSGEDCKLRISDEWWIHYCIIPCTKWNRTPKQTPVLRDWCRPVQSPSSHWPLEMCRGVNVSRLYSSSCTVQVLYWIIITDVQCSKKISRSVSLHYLSEGNWTEFSHHCCTHLSLVRFTRLEVNGREMISYLQ